MALEDFLLISAASELEMAADPVLIAYKASIILLQDLKHKFVKETMLK